MAGFRTFMLSAAVLAVSCTDRLNDAPVLGGQNAGGRIVNMSEDAVPGSLLFFVSDSDVLSSPSLDSVLALIEAEDVRKVFAEIAGEDGAVLPEAAGLAGWCKVSFGESTPLGRAAEMLASVDGVRKVQFNSRLRKASDCRSMPFIHSAVSSSSGRFNDPHLGDQWNYRNIGNVRIASTVRAGADINVSDAWRLTGGDPRVIVAVIDEGVQYDHPDLKANMWVNEAEIPGNGIDDDKNGYTDDYYGCNFVADPSDAGSVTWNRPGDSGHATHIAGTIAAVNNNGTGVCGVAGGTGSGDGVRVMTCQVFDGNDGGDLETCAKAIRYAADMGASVISCSFGFASGDFTDDGQFVSETSGIETDAIDYFLSKSNCDALDGGMAIFAAGNDHSPMATYPGAYRGCISVSAIACDNLPAYYTNYGPGCDISAPGGERFTGGVEYPGAEAPCILSTMPTESFPLYSNGTFTGYSAASYGYMEGTSMACPHVSGIVALGLSYALQTGRHFSHEEFISMLLSSVNGIDSYLTGTKRTLTDWEYGSIGSLPLSTYRYNMGTGVADAWRFLMQIEGTPCVTVPVGKQSAIDLDRILGGNASWLRNCRVEISGEDSRTLGLESPPELRDGTLVLRPGKTGAGRVVISFLAGGDSEDSGDLPSGMPVSKTLSVISRAVVPGNGGWL